MTLFPFCVDGARDGATAEKDGVFSARELGDAVSGPACVLPWGMRGAPVSFRVMRAPYLPWLVRSQGRGGDMEAKVRKIFPKDEQV